MQTGAAAGNGNGGAIQTVRSAACELLSVALGSFLTAEDVSIPHRLADAAVPLSKLAGIPEEGLEQRILAAPAPKRLGTEVFGSVSLRGKTVCLRISAAFLEKAAAEQGERLPEPVLPDEIAIPESGCAPDEGALAYAASLAVCAHRSGRPYREDKAHAALLACLMLAEAPHDRAAAAHAVRAVLKAFDSGLFGGEQVLFMAKVLCIAANKNKND